MKKLLIVLSILLMSQSLCPAEELTNQTITNQNSYLGVNFAKKPVQETGKQTIKNEKSFLFINIAINGKMPYEKCNCDNKN